MSYDPLTGLPDKQSYVSDLETLFQQEHPVVFLRADIIHLKSVNDRYGHAAGDAVICAVAKRLVEYPEFRVYRTNPVSFSILSKSKEIDLQALFEKLSKEVEFGDAVAYPKIRLFFVETEKGDNERKIAELLKYASSKRELLRDRIVRIGDELREEADQSSDLLKEILTAINSESFMVWYQPVLDVKTGKMISAESLTRLISTEGKFINPGLLFEYAEEKRLNTAITAIVLKKVCKFLGSHPELEIPSVSVNMTPEEILDPELPDRLKKITSEYGIDPHRIRLEMTERTIQRDPQETKTIMERLKALGVGTYLDDFGTGYSNLSSLIQMPFEFIKLDKSLIDTLGEPDKQEMISLLIRMIHIGEAGIIAEGIETDDQLEFIEENQVERVQGYHYSKPLNEDAFIEFAKSHI